LGSNKRFQATVLASLGPRLNRGVIRHEKLRCSQLLAQGGTVKTHLETKKVVLHQSPIIFHIARENGKGKLGRAVVREGSLTWYPGNKAKGHKISWARLGDYLVKKVPKRKRMKVRGR
jgi:hypothetical protein